MLENKPHCDPINALSCIIHRLLDRKLPLHSQKQKTTETGVTRWTQDGEERVYNGQPRGLTSGPKDDGGSGVSSRYLKELHLKVALWCIPCVHW